ncbi:MAG: hypothetical protein CEN89_661 [Candidatus Berkelbacteria bacterium Licking1014_7]|uniref:Ribosome-binding factor A n=1 Tax=Candidatus Berkelbacteria bacterium Licking1014_7 TaxID=2017147 RepID=A0A554LHZ5_9BACT|nr:MAG: hypothetical protein CEN89_661 [Candidatus Berkelbacteria bacterium Licking1014_7]
MYGDRMKKINALLHREIALFFQTQSNEKIDITIHEVITAPNLKFAKVYVSNFSAPRQKISAIASRQIPHLAKHLSKKVPIKYLPKIEFIDYHQSNQEKMDHIFKQIENDN